VEIKNIYWLVNIVFLIFGVYIVIRNAWRKRMWQKSGQEMEALRIKFLGETISKETANKDAPPAESPSPAERELVNA